MEYLNIHEGHGYDLDEFDKNGIMLDLELINHIEPCELFGFTNDNPYDTNGESKCQPCTWIRPNTLVDYNPEGLIQVVGHTPVTKGIFHMNNIWCCDALGLENPQYLVIDNGRFTIRKVYDNI